MSDDQEPRGPGRPNVLGESETLRVRIPTWLGDAIREEAERSGQTKSVVARKALEGVFPNETRGTETDSN